jgi:hypothetical protein
MFLGMMHFQDKFNQDEERLQRCDIHYLTPDLRIIPFCSFNVIPEWYRDRIQQKFGMPVEAWEKKNGRKLEDGLYRGTLRRGGHVAGCGCALGENGEEIHIQPITGTSPSAGRSRLPVSCARRPHTGRHVRASIIPDG